jgi:hypothetical protein
MATHSPRQSCHQSGCTLVEGLVWPFFEFTCWPRFKRSDADARGRRSAHKSELDTECVAAADAGTGKDAGCGAAGSASARAVALARADLANHAFEGSASALARSGRNGGL